VCSLLLLICLQGLLTVGAVVLSFATRQYRALTSDSYGGAGLGYRTLHVSMNRAVSQR
jgi:hypothetical protein